MAKWGPYNTVNLPWGLIYLFQRLDFSLKITSIFKFYKIVLMFLLSQKNNNNLKSVWFTMKLMGLKLQGPSLAQALPRGPSTCWHGLLFLSNLQKRGKFIFFVFKRHPNCVSFRLTTLGSEPEPKEFVLLFSFLFGWSMSSQRPTKRCPKVSSTPDTL